MTTITMSALGPTIAEQCEAENIIATGMPMEMVERIHHAIILAHIHGILTDSEIDRARRRLLKEAKLRRAKP